MMWRSTRSKCYYFSIISAVFVCSRASETTIVLEDNGHEIGCVPAGARDYSKYCLAIYHEGEPLAGKGFQCFFQQNLIYNCSSERKCSANEAWNENIVPGVVGVTCSGVPFLNIHKDLMGSYECRLDDTHTSVSFNLSYCTDPGSLVLELRRGGKTVEHVTLDQKEQDDYCLQVKKDNGSPASAFQCTLNGTLVYTCRSFHDCEEGGVLAAYGVVPRSVSKDSCYGIPFANMNKQLCGRYSCWMETSSGKNISGFTDVYPYSESAPGLKKDATTDANTIWVIFSVVIVIVGVVIVILGVVIKYLCSSRHRYNEDQGSPV